MIVYDVASHGAHEFVESLRGVFLEEGICLTLFTDSVNNIHTFVEFVCHFDNGLYIILKVGIDGYDSIETAFYSPFQSCP